MIHESAIIEPGASIGNNVQIGPWCYVGNDVEIGDGCVLHSHVVVKGPTKIGQQNEFYQFSSIGEDCQDKKYAGEKTELIIGDHNVFRECVTVHRGTVQDEGKTIIGSHNLFMNYVHIAHDCVIGDHNIFANNASTAGHVHVGDWVIMGGFAGAHQFCKIGSHSFAATGTLILKDIPPFVMASGFRAEPFGINTEGLKRRGFSKAQIQEIRRAYKTLYRKELRVEEALAELEPIAAEDENIAMFAEFIKQSNRGIIR
ncbi:acyl-ACP--UDP-N-acetylglucosamine O-acyltransferase [Algicola sagamiensis]|uniref:acyl-ACP--UDP-N-acetylglucosamine O-acyltransferase n=1 Tax=Algicola sagamiensis TaxID=163869 RepID=UPI00036A669E|nr:acyl-ACP--UDP-N-acetylglucosamine O-acyltransferase [Algicola sagamiensis]